MSDRKEKMKIYRRDYWQRYHLTKRRVYGSLAKAEYREMEAIADKNGRSVWGQIWSESKAYRQQSFLPSKDIEGKIGDLYIALRRIGNNINQLAKTGNLLGKLKNPSQITSELARLEQAIENFTSHPWTAPDNEVKDCGEVE